MPRDDIGKRNRSPTKCDQSGLGTYPADALFSLLPNITFSHCYVYTAKPAFKQSYTLKTIMALEVSHLLAPQCATVSPCLVGVADVTAASFD